jgi:hypothetical protein
MRELEPLRPAQNSATASEREDGDHGCGSCASCRRSVLCFAAPPSGHDRAPKHAKDAIADHPAISCRRASGREPPDGPLRVRGAPRGVPALHAHQRAPEAGGIVDDVHSHHRRRGTHPRRRRAMPEILAAGRARSPWRASRDFPGQPHAKLVPTPPRPSAAASRACFIIA